LTGLLQPVGHHPGKNFVNADRQTLLQRVKNIRRVAKPVDLSVVCIAMWMKTMSLHQLQQVSNVRGPNPAALQITLLMMPTGTPQSGRMCTSSKIRDEPGDNIPAETVRRQQSVQQRVVVDSISAIRISWRLRLILAIHLPYTVYHRCV